MAWGISTDITHLRDVGDHGPGRILGIAYAVFSKSARNFDPSAAMAGSVTVAVEELVEPGALGADAVHLPGTGTRRHRHGRGHGGVRVRVRETIGSAVPSVARGWARQLRQPPQVNPWAAGGTDDPRRGFRARTTRIDSGSAA
ncbi:hypothetical protein [Streptomyces sp. MK37H]|uniref:hypothetical protein n=1 Tax=Streptomyces sp. MK37H TaxID=2699117 RepID=UPI0035A91383